MKKALMLLVLFASLMAAAPAFAAPGDYVVLRKEIDTYDFIEVRLSEYSNPRFLFTFSERPLKAVYYWLIVTDGVSIRYLAVDAQLFYMLKENDIVNVQENHKWER